MDMEALPNPSGLPLEGPFLHPPESQHPEVEMLTMNTLKHTHLIVAALALVFLLTASGCNRQYATHEEAVNAAEDRWLAVRSAQKLKIAEQQFETGDLEQAETTLVEALSFDPKNAKLHLLAGRIELEKGRLERSFHRLNDAIGFDENLDEAYYFLGIVHQRWKQFDRALTNYQKAYELEADNVAYLIAVSEMYVALNQTDKAISALAGKVIYFDQNAGIRMALSQIYETQGEFELAADYMSQAALLRPDDMKIVEDLAMLQLAAKDFNAAESSLTRLINDPENAKRGELWRALGQAQVGRKHYSEARDSYLRATRIDRNDINAWIKLSEISMAQKNWSAALTAASRVISIDHARHEGYLLAGLIWQRRGEIDKALKHFDEAAKRSSDNVDALILRGITLEQAGRKQAAADAYRAASRRNPDDPRPRQLLSQVTGKP